MDLVVNRLSEIEAASVRILDEAAVRNKELDDASKKALQEFDARTDKETQKKLEALRANLDLEREKKLAELQADTEKVMKQATSHFEANHKRLADEIFQRLTKE